MIKSVTSATTGRRGRGSAAEIFSQDKFRLAVEACPSGMVMTDERGVIVLANAEAARLFGYAKGELTGKRLADLFGKGDNGASPSHHMKNGSTGECHILQGQRKDGAKFPVECRRSSIQAGSGQLVHLIDDITERVRADQLKDEFVSTVSHELRTPLTSISGSLGLLVGGAAGKLPEPAVRLIGIAQSNSQRLVRLINDILDIEKIESGQVVFHFQRIDVRTLVEQVIEASRGYADGFGIRVRLASTATASEVLADPDRLAQVVTNLLSNAIKFSPLHGEVAIAIETHDDSVRISVRDHGPGIPPEFRPRVFEKFAQADGSDAWQKGGTGLGLSIVKQIVARLSGDVGFADAPGGGTVFHVDLPALGKQRPDGAE
jgi:PAS domain S-box-containing protein